MKLKILLFIFFISYCSGAAAQVAVPVHTVELPSLSPKAKTFQQIGLTNMEVAYSRPAVKGRKIFGELVPYNNGKPYPWRAGADDNTVVTFQHDVKIEGNALPAGSYGLHTIPSETSWMFIFSKNNTSWGSFSYKQEEEALRVSVKPETGPQQEWLLYEFTNITDSSATLILKWEKVKVGFRIDVDTKKVTLESIRQQLRNKPGFTWAGFYSAADWCLKNNYNLEEALTWATRAATSNPAYNTIHVKAELLKKSGKPKEAEEAYATLLNYGSYNECIAYITGSIRQKNADVDNIVAAVNTRYPESKGRTYLAVGNSYRLFKDNAKAEESYNKGLQASSDEELKKRLTKAIEDLKAAR
jgi:tetratricopeptide (TPR) repeat protein